MTAIERIIREYCLQLGYGRVGGRGYIFGERILSSQTPIANERYTSSSTAIAGATQSHTRIESIQFLRFVAATIVVLYHSTVELGPHMAGDNQSALLR
jgi:hypothetical protein